ncbi:MAG TPA: ATP-dependent metallopeptidase FtsH/Yme1/Tma family protein [Verrucomicrobiae bacterium]|nr:ATP-dependent metallopeptidase FtsH/Yme1/Tma family protein [Verrucomicrobiae bacterium]
MKRLFGFTLTMLVCCVVVPPARAADAQYLRYEAFVAAVESGQVEEVRLDQYSTISGTLKENGKEEQFESFGGRIGTANDPLLLKLLKEHNVKVSTENRQEQGFWSNVGPGPVIVGLVGFLLPIATFVYVVLIYNRLKSSRSGRSED